MAVRGASSKEAITNKILEVFEGAFINGKEIRIPMMEAGERVEIKVTLTAAKENVGGDQAVESPVSAFGNPTNEEPAVTELTPEEKATIAAALERVRSHSF